MNPLRLPAVLTLLALTACAGAADPAPEQSAIAQNESALTTMPSLIAYNSCTTTGDCTRRMQTFSAFDTQQQALIRQALATLPGSSPASCTFHGAGGGTTMVCQITGCATTCTTTGCHSIGTAEGCPTN
jgi:hypothetical protein